MVLNKKGKLDAHVYAFKRVCLCACVCINCACAVNVHLRGTEPEKDQ